jgi:hypothetical protein
MNTAGESRISISSVRSLLHSPDGENLIAALRRFRFLCALYRRLAPGEALLLPAFSGASLCDGLVFAAIPCCWVAMAVLLVDYSLGAYFASAPFQRSVFCFSAAFESSQYSATAV